MNMSVILELVISCPKIHSPLLSLLAKRALYGLGRLNNRDNPQSSRKKYALRPFRVQREVHRVPVEKWHDVCTLSNVRGRTGIGAGKLGSATNGV